MNAGRYCSSGRAERFELGAATGRLIAVQQRAPLLIREVLRRLMHQHRAEVHDRAGRHLERNRLFDSGYAAASTSFAANRSPSVRVFHMPARWLPGITNRQPLPMFESSRNNIAVATSFGVLRRMDPVRIILVQRIHAAVARPFQIEFFGEQIQWLRGR